MILRTHDLYQHALPPNVHKVTSGCASKLYRFGQESYYQESSFDFSRTLSNPLSAYSSYTFVVLKPDALVCRSAHLVIKKITERGFEVCGSLRFQFNRHMWRELWRYDLNVARIARYELIDDLLCGLPSLFVLLRDQTGAADGSAHLTAIKGNTNEKIRGADSLRNQVHARAGTLNFLHCPDEFIDFIREIGVLFQRPERLQIAGWMDGVAPDTSIEANIVRAEAHCPEHALRLEELRDALGPKFADSLERDAEELRYNPYALYEQYVQDFGISKLDWICIVASFIVYSYPNIPRVFQFEVPA